MLTDSGTGKRGFSKAGSASAGVEKLGGRVRGSGSLRDWNSSEGMSKTLAFIFIFYFILFFA